MAWSNGKNFTGGQRGDVLAILSPIRSDFTTQPLCSDPRGTSYFRSRFEDEAIPRQIDVIATMPRKLLRKRFAGHY